MTTNDATDGSTTAAGGAALPTDPAGLERVIAERREHLANTVDELMVRAHPKEIARRGLAGAQVKARASVRTQDGDLRTERVGAVAAALAVLVLISVLLRRRGRRP